MDKELRKKDIVNLVKGLDISPSMYRNATEKYDNLGRYFQEVGVDADIFPQGSFSTGTIVRPYKNSKDTSYDLDFICKLNKDKKYTTAKAIKYEVYDALCKSETYKRLLCKEEYDKCWTLEYAKVDEFDFNMDIVPAVAEDDETIMLLISKGLDLTKAKESIAITNRKNGIYKWSTSNPRAYKKWFDEINSPFLSYNRQSRLSLIFNENRDLYNSAEEIPEGMERSSLQRIIQLLKRHRDVYFSKNNQEDDKPLSAIITTISAQIARTTLPIFDVFELLLYVVNEFEIYSKRQSMSDALFESTYIDKKVINRQQGKWIIMNPVNPKDNLADAWNDNPAKARCFFEWVKQIKHDFIDSLDEYDDKFVAAIENGLGSKYVQNNINKDNYDLVKPQVIANTPKHWMV